MVQRQLKPLELGELLAPVRELRLEPAAPLEPLALPQRPVDVAQRGDFALAAASPAAAACAWRYARRTCRRSSVRDQPSEATWWRLSSRYLERADVTRSFFSPVAQRLKKAFALGRQEKERARRDVRRARLVDRRDEDRAQHRREPEVEGADRFPLNDRARRVEGRDVELK